MAKRRKKKHKPDTAYAASRNIVAALPDSGITSVTETIYRMDNMTGMKKQILPHDSIVAETIAKSHNPVWSATEHRRQELVRTYHKELVTNGYGMTRAALKKKDLIDMQVVKTARSPSDFPELPLDGSDEYRAYIGENDMFYRSIPCFTEGVIRCNMARYIYFKVLNLDLENRRITLFLQDYMTALETWSPGVSGEVSMTICLKDQTANIYVDPEKRFLYSRIYRLLDYKKLFRNQKNDIQIWEHIVLPYAERTEEAMATRNTNNLMELMKIFCQYISLSNYYLLNNRPKAVRKPKQPAVTKTAKPDDAKSGQPVPENTEPPKKLVRTVGMIAITSEKPPKAVTERTAPKYKVASWKARGFTRRTKSGKLVYVRESIRHRKQLSPDGTIPQSVVLVKNNRPKEPTKDTTKGG